MRILMITIGYPPRQVGGTEVYVFGLVEALKERGHECYVAYLEPFDQQDGPEFRVLREKYLGTSVFILQVNRVFHKLEFVVFDANLRARLLEQFRLLVAELEAEIIHVHPLQLGFDSYLMEDLNEAGENVVMTFHSSTTTCARGDLLYLGKEVCDGLIIQERCTKCLYHWKSVPQPVAATLAKVPLRWYDSIFAKLEDRPPLKKLRSFVSIPLSISERRKAWTRTTSNTRAIVAVCDWVRDTILNNGAAAVKVVSSRHGLRLGAERNGHKRTGISRFGYLGRISPEKGIGLLLTTLEQMPAGVRYEFEFCSSSFANGNRRLEEEALVQAIYRLQERDKRVRILDSVTDSKLRSVLATWDALIVPSMWLESGPQVVYESFAAHTPVIGSRLGGIAELVRDRETGFLFTPGNREDLTALLKSCVENPERLRALRQNIAPVRTTADLASDMIDLYQQILDEQSEKKNPLVRAIG
jgi:glycosyltransferase involved in cell wall biosynthesis